MATGTVAVLMKIGFISEEMTKPRQLSGVSKILFSTVAVAYSYFFLHIAVFGPPVSEIFKGTFFMGVAVMSLLLFKSRQSSLREGFVWLDEFFALVSMVMDLGILMGATVLGIIGERFGFTWLFFTIGVACGLSVTHYAASRPQNSR